MVQSFIYHCIKFICLIVCIKEYFEKKSKTNQELVILLEKWKKAMAQQIASAKNFIKFSPIFFSFGFSLCLAHSVPFGNG